MKNRYSAFGLIIESEIKLPELVSLKEQNEKSENIPIDIYITFGQIPKSIDDSKIKSIWYEAALGEYLLKVDGIANYYVKDGKKIIIEPNENSLEEDIRVFLLNSVFSAILQQRGILVFHASAAVVNGKSIVFAGISDSGKTAIALSLYDRGYDLICDEICAIKIENGEPMVLGGIPQLNVWQDTLTKAEKDISKYKTIRQGINKFAFNFKDRYCNKSIELSHVIILKNHNKDEVIIKEIKGVEKFDKLMRSAYKFQLEELFIGKEQLFKNHSNVGKNSKMMEVTFNEYPYEVNHVVDLILKGVEKINE